jgi:ribosome biogenesis protein MAK21
MIKGDIKSKSKVFKGQKYKTKTSLNKEDSNTDIESLSNKEKQWLDTVVTKGTITDRISALALLAQHPYNEAGKNAVFQLISMMKRVDRRISGMAMQNLKDVFTISLLPKNRELSLESEQDQIVHSLYYNYLHAVVEKTKDTVLHTKQHAIRILCDLLEYPEQRQYLLSELVNKFGDVDKQASSLAIHLLLVATRRFRRGIKNFKSSCLEEVQRLIYRQNISKRTLFYSVVFMNGLVLDGKNPVEKKLAEKMLDMYFSLFDDILGKPEDNAKDGKKKENKKNLSKKLFKKKKGKSKNEGIDMTEVVLNDRLLTAVLTGIARVVEVAGFSSPLFEKHIDKLFFSSHSSFSLSSLGEDKARPAATFISLSSSLRSLLLLHLLFSGKGGTSALPDRYYNALYEILLHPAMPSSSSLHPLLLSLLYNSCRFD